MKYLLLAALTFLTVQTHSAQDVRDQFGGHYVTYDEIFPPERSTVESVRDRLGVRIPFYRGPRERAVDADNENKREYCEKTVRRACRVKPEGPEAVGSLRADAINCRLLPEAPMGTYDGGACPRACLAWNDDCKELISDDDLRSILADELD